MNDPSRMPWRDPALSIAERAASLVSHLALEEKIGQLMMACPAIPRLGIQAYDWWSEALHGVGRNGIATVFPQAIGLGATWNPLLIKRIAAVISLETRAKHHAAARASGGATGRYQGLTLWSPNVNLFRDPRWGRGQECYGEDVCLTARLGAAFVRGLQGDDSRHLKTVATPKHFAAHNGPENGRFAFNAVVSPRDLWEEELSVFEFVIGDGGACSVMTAYNAINGAPCAANHRLLTEVLRGRWGFRGAIVSDVDNLVHLAGAMGYARDSVEACALAIQAGLDLCSGRTFEKLGEAVFRGLVSEAELDRNLARNLELRFRLGQFDPPEQVSHAGISADVVDAPDHDRLALEAARQSIVLLKNNGVLPLDLSRLQTVAILGPTADNPAAMLGNYSGVPARPATLLAGLRRKFESAGVKTIHYRAVPLVLGLEKSGHPLNDSGCLFADVECMHSGMAAEIFPNPDFAGKPVAVDNIGLDLFWNIYQPLPPIPAENASILWTGFLRPPTAGKYTFTIEIIGGVRLSVGGEVLLNGFRSVETGTRQTHSVDINLINRQPVPITVEFRQSHGDGLFSLRWKTPLDPEDTLPIALAAAREADHIILCLGLTPEVEGEEMPVNFEGFKAGDRTTIQLPAPQQELLKQASALGKPLTVLLTTGSALTFDVSQASAILCAWYYGQCGGEAVAEALVGEINPAGRLPVTFYSSDAELPPIENYAMEGRTYKFIRGRPLFAFGHGLSYTSFRYGEATLDHPAIAAGATAILKINVTNTGAREGDEVVQVYARNPCAGPDRPTRQLIGFQRQGIAAGQTVEVSVTLDTRLLRHWDETIQNFACFPGQWLLEIGPSSDRRVAATSLVLFPESKTEINRQTKH